MLTIADLRDYGANVDEGLSRCMGDEDMYLRLVDMTLGNENFDKLSRAVAAGDKDAAFDAVHALKGVLGNLALTPLYDSAYEMTELLRAREDADYQAHLDRILRQRDDLLARSAG